jgi:hypothetical protein
MPETALGAGNMKLILVRSPSTLSNKYKNDKVDLIHSDQAIFFPKGSKQ